MKSIVIYESRYGSTEKYAKWIGEELNCKVSRVGDIKIDELLNYDNIIFGGWLHAGNIKGFKNISKNMERLKEKNIIVFYVGLSVMNDKLFEEVNKNNFKHLSNIKQFYLRGAFNFENLTASDKLMMNMFKAMIKKQKYEDLDINTKGMLEVYTTPVDFIDKDSIKPIVESVNIMNIE